MVLIRKNKDDRISVLCEDLPGRIPHQRLLDAWGNAASDIYPLAATSIDYIDGDFICCGRMESSQWHAVSQTLNLKGSDNPDSPPGTVILRWESLNGQRIIICLGREISGLLYAIESLTQRSKLSINGLLFEGEPLTESPALDYRIFWTWDHSTNWALGYEGQLDWGCMNTYLKPPEAYIDDYKRQIDWASRNRINGIMIWGFLRDSHGGIEAAQEICRYAKNRGVRILVGIGTSFYGGFYYKGKHPFNADEWLRIHPEYAARDKTGNPTDRLCPSEPANQEWLREGTHWLFNTFDIGGVNLESGDFMVCYCNRCVKQRDKLGGNDPDVFKEMYLSITPVIDEILRIRDDAWITFGTYTGFNPLPLPRNLSAPDTSEVFNMANMGSAEPIVVRAFPPETIFQWSLTAMVQQEPAMMLDFLHDGRPVSMLSAPDWPEKLRPPAEHNIGLIHQGSQWYSREKGHTRYHVEITSIKEACMRAAEAGLEGLAITGEASPLYTPIELNYLALSHFSYHPNDSLLEFAKKILSPLVGGNEFSVDFVTYMAKRETGQMTEQDEASLADRLKYFMSKAEKGGGWHPYRRWRWLSTYYTPNICDGTASVLPTDLIDYIMPK